VRELVPDDIRLWDEEEIPVDIARRLLRAAVKR
jgi:hypothetical protein